MNWLLVVQILQLIFSILIVILALIQYKGKGLASSIGSSFAFYGSRRGAEKIIFIVTIIVSALLVVNSLAILLLSK